MQTSLAIAALLAFAVGAVHSALGERLIFRRMRAGALIPTEGRPVLHEGHVRILWASWHVLTLFGWTLGAILLHIAMTPSGFEPLAAGVSVPDAFLLQTIAAAMFGGSMLVLIGTRGRHPGWIGLLAITLLIVLF